MSSDKENIVPTVAPTDSYQRVFLHSRMTKFVTSTFPAREILPSTEPSMDCHNMSSMPSCAKSYMSEHSITNSPLVDVRLSDTSPIEIIVCSNSASAVTPVRHDEEKDPHGPLQVTKKVKMVIHRWGPVEPINPERFFLKMLLSRGYATKMIPALQSEYRRYESLLHL